MITLSGAANMRNQRVWVERGGAEPGHFIFRSLTPKNFVILAGEGGLEQFVPLADLTRVELAPVVCPECSAEHNIDRASKRCADCERQYAYKQPDPSETCQDCSGLGAVYSPAGKAWRCVQCHAKAGSLTGSGPELRVLTQAALCRSDDLHSERHAWKKLKSSYVCRNCEVRVHDKPGGYRG